MDDLKQRIADLEAANKVLLAANKELTKGLATISIGLLAMRLSTVEDAWKKSRVAYAKLEARIKELEERK